MRAKGVPIPARLGELSPSPKVGIRKDEVTGKITEESAGFLGGGAASPVSVMWLTPLVDAAMTRTSLLLRPGDRVGLVRFFSR